MVLRRWFVFCVRVALVAATVAMPACGGSPKPELYTHDAGNFRVLMAGKPGKALKTVASAAGPLDMNSTETVDGNRVQRAVVYTDFPKELVQSSDPSALLDGGVHGMSTKSRWSVESESSITLDGHPGREVDFTVTAADSSEPGTGRARFFLVGSRLYEAIIVGPSTTVSDDEFSHFFQSFELVKKVASAALSAPSVRSETTAAAPAMLAQASPRPAAPAPANKPASPTPPPAQPAPAATEEPTALSAQPAPAAPAGGQTVVTESVTEPPFDPPPASQTAATRPSRTKIARSDRNRAGNQVPAENQPITTEDQGPDPSQPAETSIRPGKAVGRISERPPAGGNPRDRFRELGPAHSALVGVRVGFAEAFGGIKIGSIQPIFQEGNKYVMGTQIGRDGLPSATIMAKPGYAVGAINTQSGLLLDGLQLIFMRYKTGRLETHDSYRTDWLGDANGGRSGGASSGGKQVVGLHGRSNGREIKALGLLVSE